MSVPSTPEPQKIPVSQLTRWLFSPSPGQDEYHMPGAPLAGIVSGFIRTIRTFLGPLLLPVNSFFSSSCGCPTLDS
jgi:hypothetical protein